MTLTALTACARCATPCYGAGVESKNVIHNMTAQKTGFTHPMSPGKLETRAHGCYMTIWPFSSIFPSVKVWIEAFICFHIVYVTHSFYVMVTFIFIQLFQAQVMPVADNLLQYQIHIKGPQLPLQQQPQVIQQQEQQQLEQQKQQQELIVKQQQQQHQLQMETQQRQQQELVQQLQQQLSKQQPQQQQQQQQPQEVKPQKKKAGQLQRKLAQLAQQKKEKLAQILRKQEQQQQPGNVETPR